MLYLLAPKWEGKKIEKNNIGDAWNLFITEDMLKIILSHTNDETMDRRCKLKEPLQSYTKIIYFYELQVFIGLL